MRILFVTFPWHTHFQFCVPMAWALRTAGHEVHFAGNRELTDVIAQAGMTAVPVGPDETFQERVDRVQKEALGTQREGDTLPAEPQAGTSQTIDLGENREERFPWSFLKVLHAESARGAAFVNDPMIDDLVEYCRWWKPDLVVWEWLTYAGAVAAAAVGAAHARLPIGVGVEARLRRHFLKVRAEQDPADREDPMREWLGAWGEKYGFEFSEDLVTGQFTIDQVPDSMRVACELPHVSVRYVPYNGRAVVPDWVRHEPRAPRVLATFGTSTFIMSKSQPVLDSQRLSIHQLQDMLDSMADLDIELIVTLPANVQEQLERVPENTRLVEFVPLHVIIPSCSAVIHHGGLPAFCSALAHGIPQIMLTMIAPDASLRGGRLQEAQAGEWISPERVKGKRIRDSLVRLLEDPACRAGVERLRQEVLAQPSPNEAVPELERLVAEFGSR